MHIPSHIFQQAIQLYLAAAYPAKIPAAVATRTAPLFALVPTDEVPLDLLERDPAASFPSYLLRLGQPLYPHMKLVADSAPIAATCGDPLLPNFLLRVDSHDRHLHAAPGSPDAAWLSTIRLSNKEIGEKIEAAWSAAGLPTFKDFLRRQLDARKKSQPPSHP